MAVEPQSHEVYLSVSAGKGDKIDPQLVKVGLDGKVTDLHLSAMRGSEWAIKDPPSPDETFRDRTGDWPVPSAAKYHAKAKTPMRTMTIVDMKYHNGELFISGISNEEFASTLRRVAYPFRDGGSETQVSHLPRRA